MINPERISRDVVLFGGSAGGLSALLTVLKHLPVAPVSIAIVLHRSPTHESQLTTILGRVCILPVSEPTDGEAIALGHAYLAPRDVHMTVDDGRWRLTRAPKVHWARPAINPLFISAADHFGARTVGILLSGAGSDGVRGLITVKARGGISLAQDPAEAQHDSMPVHAILNDHVDAVLKAAEIAAAIPTMASGKPHDTPARRLVVR
jgi:two-component system chemotaxis response regulator CheB